MTFNWDTYSPFGNGDTLSVSGLGTEAAGLINGRVAYSRWLAPNGLRGDIEATKTDYVLKKEMLKANDPPDLFGNSYSVGMGVSYPIVRTKARTIETSARYNFRELKDYIVSKGVPNTELTSTKHSNTLTAGVSLRDESLMWGSDGVTQGNINLTYGHINMDGVSLSGDQSEGGPKTAGYFSRLNAGLSRFSVLSPDYTASASLRAQWALDRNLDSSERMGVAGPASVAAYPSGELSGSDAYFVRLELTRNLSATDNWSRQVQVFTNAGSALPLKNINDVGWRHLSDVGVGFTAKHADGFLLKSQLAYYTTGSPQSESSDRMRFLVQFGWLF